jgi:hypothetical protein
VLHLLLHPQLLQQLLLRALQLQQRQQRQALHLLLHRQAVLLLLMIPLMIDT